MSVFFTEQNFKMLIIAIVGKRKMGKLLLIYILVGP